MSFVSKLLRPSQPAQTGEFLLADAVGRGCKPKLELPTGGLLWPMQRVMKRF